MKLIDIAQYRKLRFVGPKLPDSRTIMGWIENGDLPGRKIGKKYFVDVEAESNLTGFADVDEVINS